MHVFVFGMQVVDLNESNLWPATLKASSSLISHCRRAHFSRSIYIHITFHFQLKNTSHYSSLLSLPFAGALVSLEMPKKVELDQSRRRAPKGHFVVYVGSRMTRFVVPTSYLKNPVFQQLLEKAADEYGYDSHNRIVLPCDESTFQRLTTFLAKHT